MRKLSYKIPPSLYKKILNNIPILCADLAIYSKGKVLLIYRKDFPAKNKWGTIRGRVYKNESLQEAVLRKAYEEAGVKVKIKKQIGLYEFRARKGIFSNLKNGFHSFSVVYLVELENENQRILIDSTSKRYKWIDRIEKNLDNYVQKILKDSKIFK